MSKHQRVLIIDFGGQYCQMVARRVRECQVYCEVVPYTKAMGELEKEKPVGMIMTGGTSGVNQEGAHAIDTAVYSMGIPVLGIGYGAHRMVQDLGGRVDALENPSAGETRMERMDGLVKTMDNAAVWMGHSDFIAQMPDGFVGTGQSENHPFAAIENTQKRLYALQFHPEMEQTVGGAALLKAFLFDVCGCTGDWTTASFVESAVASIRETVGEKGRVLCALSGGVDSSVCAVLTHKAIGDRLYCVFVDHGLMRKNEGDEVMRFLNEAFDLNIVRVNAGERFLGKLAGVTDPEQKRKIIGHEFIEVFTDEAKKLGDMDFLLQGTIYPDVIESGLGDGAVIKSHHNVGGLPEKLGFALLEPMRQLFKDEVRAVGREMGMPDPIVDRQPFPGPGLAVRCLGEITEDKLFILRESDAILREEIAGAGLDKEIWQYFTVLPNIRSVGMKGEERTYSHAVGIRAVNSTDAMTSDWYRIPYNVLERISSRIVTEVPNVNRVLYDCTTKPPSTIEWE